MMPKSVWKALKAIEARQSQEEWKDIAGYEGVYQVSNQGRVRSVDRFSDGRFLKGRILKESEVGSGYMAVSLYKDGKPKTARVAALVLTAFVGVRPTGYDCCHADDDKLNNNLSNLRWDTKKANGEDKVKNGRSTSGARNGRAKLSDDDVRSIKTRLAAGEVRNKLRKEFNVSFRTIERIRTGETWGNV